MQARVLLGVHGPVERARYQLVQLQSVRGEERVGGTRQPGEIPAVAGTLPSCELPPLCRFPRLMDISPQYYNRYANHDLSAKLDKDLYIKTEKKMTMLQTTSGMSWIEVQYLEQASQVLQQCRQTLKWTYAFAFYLERNNNTYIFEDNQKDLEMAVEQLSELFEKPPDALADNKKEMMDRTAYVNNRRRILLEDTAEGLKERR